MILHSQSPSTILPLITQTAFSSSLLHIIAHPPVLLTHIATEFLMPPPPLTPLPKFWSLFLPISERVHDTEQLVFGADGEGSKHQTEFVIEVVVREGNRQHRGVERVLEGWSTSQGGPCELTGLECLSHLLKKQKVVRTTFWLLLPSYTLNPACFYSTFRRQIPHRTYRSILA